MRFLPDAYATAELERSEMPSVELIDLISDGHERCVKRPAYEFRTRALDLGCVQEFSLREIALSMESDDSILQFAKWAARRCIGGDLTRPMVWQ